MAAGVVVWEWQNEYGGWRPYSPQITAYLESNKDASVPLHLGSVDPILYLYQVDVKNLCQTRQGTGTQRPIRRTVLPSSSPLAKGITWQWEGDALGSWCDFDIALINYLDECYVKGQTFIDLSKSKFFLPYHIDLKAMTQKRIETGRVRNVQRTFTSVSYPRESSAPSSSGTKRQSASSSCKSTSTSPKKSKLSTISSSAFGATPSAPSSSTASGFSVSNGAFTPNSNPAMLNGIGPQPHLPNPFIHTHQGPITRRRFIQTQSALSHQNQSGSSVPTTNQSVPVTMSSAFSAMPSHSTSVPQTGSPFLTFTNIAGFQPSAFGNQGPSSLGPAPVFGGNPMHGFNYHQSSTGNSAQQGHYYSGSLNTALLFGSGRQGRVRPSQGAGASSSQASSFSSTSGSQLPPYDRIPNHAPKASKRGNKTTSAAEDILHNYVESLTSPPADEDCCICCEKLIEASGHGFGSAEDHVVYKLGKCSHMFHKLCLTAMYDSGAKDGHIQCPTCKTIYGEKMGNCPRGDMEYKIIDHHLHGYEGHRTIQIMYSISSGIQGPEHPNPGKRYTTRGFPRIGYLPDCDKGRKVLQLLIIAWKRRLTFTIGHSTTTGEDNTVTWNEIHHKTELGSNYSGHGYPDPKYLDNVLNELAVHGISEKDLPSG